MALENNLIKCESCPVFQKEIFKVDYYENHIQFYKFEGNEWIPSGKLVGLKQLISVIESGDYELLFSHALKKDVKEYIRSIKRIKLKVF